MLAVLLLICICPLTTYSLDFNVYKECNQSGNGLVFCIGSKGMETSLPHQSGGCIMEKSCTLVVQGERKPVSADEPASPVAWQVWSRRFVPKGSQSVRLAFSEVQIGTGSGPQQFQQLPHSTLFIELLITEEHKLKAFCAVGSATPLELNPLEEERNFILPASDIPRNGVASSDAADFGGDTILWDFFRILTPRKLVYINKAKGVSVNVNVGALHSKFSIWAHRDDHTVPPNGLISGIIYKMWAERAPDQPGDPKVELEIRPERSKEKDTTGMFVAIGIGIIAVILLIVAGVAYVFHKRAKRRRLAELSSMSSYSYVPSTTAKSEIKPPVVVYTPSSLKRPPPVPSVKSSKNPFSVNLPGRLASRRISSVTRGHAFGSNGPTASGTGSSAKSSKKSTASTSGSKKH